MTVKRRLVLRNVRTYTDRGLWRVEVGENAAGEDRYRYVCSERARWPLVRGRQPR